MEEKKETFFEKYGNQVLAVGAGLLVAALGYAYINSQETQTTEEADVPVERVNATNQLTGPADAAPGSNNP